MTVEQSYPGLRNSFVFNINQDRMQVVEGAMVRQECPKLYFGNWGSAGLGLEVGRAI